MARLTEAQRDILKFLAGEHQIGMSTNFAAITALEMRGLIECRPIGRFERYTITDAGRKALEAPNG
jgi:DNA-binding MarR family transcriptional regulator